jgi:hypothetical protein
MPPPHLPSLEVMSIVTRCIRDEERFVNMKYIRKTNNFEQESKRTTARVKMITTTRDTDVSYDFILSLTPRIRSILYILK